MSGGAQQDYDGEAERDQEGEEQVEEEQVEGEAEAEEDDEKEIEELKNKMAVLEEEAIKLQAMQEQIAKNLETPTVDREEIDQRSVYVGNVDYQTKPKELQEHFHACGTILRITILCDKWTGHPKGFAYVEFMDKSGVTNALELNESLFKGRTLKVMAKRTNLPGITVKGRRRVVVRRRSRRRTRRSVNYSYAPYY